MKVSVLCVGRPSRLLAGAIGEYETRAARYWKFDVIEVREERASGGKTEASVRDAEAERLLERVPEGARVVALTRDGTAWPSTRLARHLEEMAVLALPGVAFLIGGAYGLGEAAIRNADQRLSLSPLTMTHELARLVLAEQLYRSGTIVRGEPYHKAEV